MSMFGKILAVFNVLAALGFLALAGMDYSKRYNWSYQHFRHQLAIHGLPVTDSDESWRLTGRTIADDLTEKTLNDVFQPVGGSPSKTQVEELDKVRDQIKGQVDQAANDAAKKLLIAKYLFPLARTGAEREQYQQAVRDPKVSAETLWNQLNGLIEVAKSRQKRLPDDRVVERSLPEWRDAIADVLYNLSPDGSAAWHQRVLTVVGLENYIGAADRQANNLQQMTARLTEAITDENAAFVRQYQSLLPELVLLDAQVKELDGRLKEQQELVQRHTALRNARQAEVEKFQADIRTATAAAGREMGQLQDLQRRLFALQQELATAQATNQQLEQQLRTTETGR